MPSKTQRNFAGGELAPAMHGRTDVVKYQTGAEILRNMQTMRSGGAQNRPGEEFLAECHVADADPRIARFVRNGVDYLVEFGHQKVRVLQDGALYTKLWHYVTAATNANPCVVTIQNFGADRQTPALINGCRVTFSGLAGMTQLNGNTYKIKTFTSLGSGLWSFELTDTSDVNINSSAYGVFTQSGVGKATSMSTITGATQASPCVLTITGHGYIAGDEITVSGITGMTELNGRNFIVGTVTANTLQLKHFDGSNVNSTTYTAYASGGTTDRVLVLPSSYTADELDDLQFSGDRGILAISHPDHAVGEIRQHATLGDFALYNPSLAGGISAPTISGITGSGAGTDASRYVVTAIDALTGEESLPSADVALLSNTHPFTVNITGVTGAREYNVYEEASGLYGYVGTTQNDGGTIAFVHDGEPGDFSINPPYDRNLLDSADKYPAVIGSYQRRRMYGRSNNEPEAVWGSRVDCPASFQQPTPLTDDSPVTFTLSAKQQSIIRHLVDAGVLVILTSEGEWVCDGDQAGILTPTGINARQYDEYGANRVAPVVANGAVVFVQANGSMVVSFTTEQGTRKCEDLTLFSSHLFDGYDITGITFQRTPHPILWAVRSDGKMLGQTMIRSQEMLGWHRHDTDGEYQRVCVLKENGEDRLYTVVSRTVGGASKRYIERRTSRMVSDAVFLDSLLTYNGVQSTGTVALTGSGWTYLDTLTLTVTGATPFKSSDVGNAVHLTGADGTLIRFTITGYTANNIVTGRPHQTVPVGMRATAISTWTIAVDSVSNLWHLEGREVAVIADDFVVANPLVSSYTVKTVSGGAITLDRGYGVIHVGLPFISDVKTLKLDTPEGASLSHRNILVSRVSLKLNDSRGIWVGVEEPTDDDTDPLEGLTELKARNREGMDSAVELSSRDADILVQGRWQRGGQVFIRQVDPLPMEILSVTPHYTVEKD